MGEGAAQGVLKHIDCLADFKYKLKAQDKAKPIARWGRKATDLT